MGRPGNIQTDLLRKAVGKGTELALQLGRRPAVLVFEMVREADHGVHFTSAISNEEIHLAGTGFVDDTNLDEKLADTESSMQETIESAQASVDLFIDGMGYTGGQPRPPKCWCYFLCPQWRQGIWSYQTDDFDKELTILDGSGTRQTIKRLNPDVATENLGVWTQPDGGNKKAVAEMTNDAKTWSELVRTKHIRRADVWQSIQTTIMPKLQYPLLALTLSEKDCKTIEAPLRKYGFPECGVNRTLPHKVVNGPANSHGLNNKRLYFSYGEKHIRAVMKHLEAWTVTGMLMRACVEILQLEAGISTSILASEYRLGGQLVTRTWITGTWKYMSAHKVKIKANVALPTPQREHDTFIMEAFYAAELPIPLLRKANRCRMYLQAMTVADIATGNGSRIRRDAWTGVLEIHRN